MSASLPLLHVNDLSVRFKTTDGFFDAVRHVSFSLEKGKSLALVGESGSGKSVTALSLLQLLPYPLASHPSGSIRFDGQEMIGATPEVLRRIRGNDISMIFQEPMTSLNPLHTIFRQIAEVIILHNPTITKDETEQKVLSILDLVGLPKLKDRLGSYPHELSGGQRQRVMIGMALANTPKILIADEPTTALDVTVQAQILDLLQDLKSRLSMSLILISHDLKVVEKMCDHVCVMQKGEIVENAPKEKLFADPAHAYTKQLLSAKPRHITTKRDMNAPLVLDAKNIVVRFPVKKNLFGKTMKFVDAVDDISFTLRKGQTLGIVGESGSGKTTLGLSVLRLLKSSGKIVFLGNDLSTISAAGIRALRAQMQIVFQDPFGSLSPRMSVAEIIGEGLSIHFPALSKDEREQRIIEALENVQLSPDTRHRYPHEFSGGQRQRISIARALVLHPSMIILDEPTSALDVSVQAQVVALLQDLQNKYDLSYIFISHDLNVVRAMAHDILVMKDGKTVEYGDAETVFTAPQEDYTKQLMQAALHLKSAV